MNDLGERIKQARLLRGLSQAALGKALGRDDTVVSKIERGDRGVNSFELALIAETLAFPADDLLGRRRPSFAMGIAARLADVAEPAGAEEAIGRARSFFELDGLLDGLLPRGGAPDISPLTLMPGSSPVQEGRRLAREVRRQLRLGDAPISSLPNIIEQAFDVDVAIEPIPDGIDGLCIQFAGAHLLIANADHYPGRQAFTLAHELCHFLCSDSKEVVVEKLFGSRQESETRANAFAAWFLMPEAAIDQIIRTRAITSPVLVDLIEGLTVSLQALTYHLQNLKRITAEEAENYRRVSPKALFFGAGRATSWLSAEQTRGQRRLPSRLEKRVTDAYTRGLIGIGPVAQLYMRADTEMLRQELEHQGVKPPAFEEASPLPATAEPVTAHP